MASRTRERYFKVVTKFRQWTNPEKCNPQRLRGVLLGFILNETFAEIVAYKILHEDVTGGELPRHVPDIVIISVSFLEALAAPLLSWWGARRLRLTLALWMLVQAAAMCCWFALPAPNVREGSEFCDAANKENDTSFTGMTHRSVVRLVTVVIPACVFALARAAVWTHGVAFCHENAPDMITVNYGVILSMRAVALFLGHKIFTSLADTNLSGQVMMLVVGNILNPVQLPFIVPKHITPPESRVGGGFLASMSRVCSNGLAMSQMVALALLAAALWGYGYYESDIIRAKFLLHQDAPNSDNIVKMVQYVFIFCILMYAATRASSPVLNTYCRLNALRHVIFLYMLVVLLFAGLALPACDTGNVAGLGADYFGHPECSFQCGCQPRWQEFFPVCETNSLVTYLSPCLAGCTAADTVNGINVFVNCTCGGANASGAGAHVVVGACTASGCWYALDFHHNIFLVLVTVSLLAFQAQGVLVLKSVEGRDRALALGVHVAVVAAVAFVAGPLLYLGINMNSCRWFEGDKCHLFNESFPKTVGFTSAFIALLATLLCVVIFVCMWLAERSKKQQTDKPNESYEDIELS